MPGYWQLECSSPAPMSVTGKRWCMCVGMCVCFVCACVCCVCGSLHVRVCVCCKQVYVSVHVCMGVYMYMCIYMCVCVCTYVCVFMRVHACCIMYTDVCICTCMCIVYMDHVCSVYSFVNMYTVHASLGALHNLSHVYWQRDRKWCSMYKKVWIFLTHVHVKPQRCTNANPKDG